MVSSRETYTYDMDKKNNEYIDQLKDFLTIASVSADSKFTSQVQESAQWVKNALIESGCDTAEIYPTQGHPIVMGTKIIDAKLPTVMVYGHYDVQPPDPLDLWESDPFEPIIKRTPIHPEGALFARGACDDKGQLFIHIKAFEELIFENNLQCNVTFLIEGEEEVGSTHLEEFITNYKEKLKADLILISDTAMISKSQPSITTGLRGLSYIEVTLEGPSIDLHSGVYGGAVPNPINQLSQMIGQLHDENQKITIPGFYDDVLPLDKASKAEIFKEAFDEKEFKQSIGINDIIGEKHYSTIERKSTRPSLDVNGIWGGYILEGTKTVIPSKASAKISMRLVPNQKWEKMTQDLEQYLIKITPDAYRVSIQSFQGGDPYVVSRHHLGYQAAHLAYQKTFGVSPIATRGGGSIPIVSSFEKVLGIKTILMGFGLDSDAIHSPNEHFGLYNFFKGIQTVKHFYHHYTNLSLQDSSL
ncbi:MAG: dipeptidase [Flavobacteriaceae bacterium]|nr:dipeptidase [Flavobacteriaceae bacterium]